MDKTSENNKERKYELWEIMEGDLFELSTSYGYLREILHNSLNHYKNTDENIHNWDYRKNLAIEFHRLDKISCYMVRTELFQNRKSYPPDLIINDYGYEVPRLLLIYLTSLYEQKTTTYRDEMFRYLINMHPKLLLQIRLSDDKLSYLVPEYIRFIYKNGVVIEVEDIDNLFDMYCINQINYDRYGSWYDVIYGLIDYEIICGNISKVYSVLEIIYKYLGDKFLYYKALLKHGDKELIKYAIQSRIKWLRVDSTESTLVDINLYIYRSIVLYAYNIRKLDDVIVVYEEMEESVLDLLKSIFKPNIDPFQPNLTKEECSILGIITNRIGIDKMKEVYDDNHYFKQWYNKVMFEQV